MALGVGGTQYSDIWVSDFNRETRARLIFDEDMGAVPIWTPDSQQIIYSSSDEAQLANGIWVKSLVIS